MFSSHCAWDFILIFFILGVIVPWRRAIRVRKLLAHPALTTTDRLALYASTIAFQWLAVAIVAWRSLARGLSLPDLGLILPRPLHTAIVTILITTAFCAFQFFGLRHSARLPPDKRGLVQQLAFTALVVTVALCEEFLYRGFVFAAISRATRQFSFAAALSSALLFAVAHLYQGRRGLISTFLIGIVFAIVRITEQSLAPAIVAHLFVDLFAGLLAPRVLLRPSPQPAAVTAAPPPPP